MQEIITLNPPTQEIANAMRAHTSGSIASINTVISDTDGEFLGSGFYLTLCGKPHIITCEHVARKRRTHSLGHTLKPGSKAYRIVSPFICHSGMVDLADSRIDEEIFNTGTKTTINGSRIAQSHKPADKELFFLHGFAGKNTYSGQLVGGVYAKSTPYITQEAELPIDPDVSSECHFAIHLPAHLEIHPPGFSGSAIWDTRWIGTLGKDWTPAVAAITGVAAFWHQNSQTLIGIKAEFLRWFLLHCLRKEAAYFHWDGRGRPTDDDKTDWLWAEQSIQDIV